MGKIAGIKYTKDATGRKRYLWIDLDIYGENQLIKDLLDFMEFEARKEESTYPLDEVMKESLNAED